MHRFALIPLLAATIFPSLVHAQTTQLDPSFATAGKFSIGGGSEVFVKTLAHLPLPQGGSVAVLNYQSSVLPGCPTGLQCIAFNRFNTSGVPQAFTFAPTSINFTTLGGAAIDSVGRIVVVGSLVRSGVDRDFHVARFFPDGSADTSFDSTGNTFVAFDFGLNNVDQANAVAIDERDRIVVVGYAERSSTNDFDFAMARLLPNGQLDTSFSGSGKRTVSFDLGATDRLDIANALVIGRDRKISIGGRAYDSAVSVSRIALVRLLDNGSLDTTFCPTTCNFQDAYSAINSGRRVIFYGNSIPAQNDTLSAMTINASGTLITAGVTPGGGVNRNVYAQRFDTAGNWVAESASDVGAAGPAPVVRSIHWTDNGQFPIFSKIKLTGVAGPNEEFFFAQQLNSDLTPSSNWGLTGPSGSVYLWSMANTLGDFGNNQAGISTLDPYGRLLTGGAYKRISLAGPYGAAVARITNSNPFASPDVIFRTNF